MTDQIDSVNVQEYRFIREEVERLDKKYAMPICVNRPLPDKLNSHGWVYILSNPFMPGLIKIGMTTTSPQIRCKELSSGTNVPAPFIIEASFFSEDPRRDEASIHAALSEHRVNSSREFFSYGVADAIEVCEHFCLCVSSSSMEELSNTHDIICLDEPLRLDLHEWFEEFGLRIVGPKVNAAKAIFELGCDRLDEMRRDGIGLIIEDGYTHGMLTEDVQSNLAYLEQSHEKAMATGIYGPKLPGGF
ncbi:GIY-YIG nuclease family protein [Serratia fonticola]|uniref:GIY-YIG nuclease family protein n=1 Tax=Serratia fonticola TaxID=47917 RepID=UPI003B004976